MPARAWQGNRSRESIPIPSKRPPREFQVDAPEAHTGSPTGLFDFRVNQDINVVLGCGFGGTSLINANVGLRAEPRVFDDPAWPDDFRKDTALLERSYRLAEEVLGMQPVPQDFPRLPKMEAHQRSAEAMGAKWYRTPLYVTFENPKDGVNQFGVPQQACIGCGDCVSGCNFHAKNTTLMNYLPDAVNFGAEIFTEVAVTYLERKGDGWLVHFQPLGVGRREIRRARSVRGRRYRDPGRGCARAPRKSCCVRRKTGCRFRR